MNTEYQELKVKTLCDERDILRNKDIKFTAYIFVAILAIVITLSALIMNKYFDLIIPSATTMVFTISSISLFVLKHTKKKIVIQENIVGDKYEQALSQLEEARQKV
ncbi:hypothetical protein [Sulfurimonas sp.]|uniref:hypothetical protein n=1 Tax=Sulfurimonas sp. TaxID=2022749 RepID=UPI0025D90DDB|nr:hypothetical protein [Sulfurimonas sp.]